MMTRTCLRAREGALPREALEVEAFESTLEKRIRRRDSIYAWALPGDPGVQGGWRREQLVGGQAGVRMVRSWGCWGKNVGALQRDWGLCICRWQLMQGARIATVFIWWHLEGRKAGAKWLVASRDPQSCWAQDLCGNDQGCRYILCLPLCTWDFLRHSQHPGDTDIHMHTWLQLLRISRTVSVPPETGGQGCLKCLSDPRGEGWVLPRHRSPSWL